MMKYFVGALLLSLLFVSPVAAQDSETEAARRYNITFPIAELDGCVSLSACKTYCNDASHQEACIAFAKKKGFYSEMKVDEKRAQLVENAKSELGCSSETECRSYCNSEANRERCIAFAKKHGFDGEKKEAEVVQKAKSSLGCDSYESCKTYCEQEANRERCSNFARAVGISRSEGTIEREEMRKKEEMMRQERPGMGTYPTGGMYPGTTSYPTGTYPTVQPQSKEDYCRQYPERCREGGMETNTGTIDYQPDNYPTIGQSQPGTMTYPTGGTMVSPTGGSNEGVRVQGVSTRRNLWELLSDFLARFKR